MPAARSNGRAALTKRFPQTLAEVAGQERHVDRDGEHRDGPGGAREAQGGNQAREWALDRNIVFDDREAGSRGLPGIANVPPRTRVILPTSLVA